MKLRVRLVTQNELWGCQLVVRTTKSVGARGDVQNFGGCQAPKAPVLTQALEMYSGEDFTSRESVVCDPVHES